MADPDSPLIQAELMPDDPDVVLVTIPDVAYLDASAGEVEIGFDLGQLPELIAALRPWLGAD